MKNVLLTVARIITGLLFMFIAGGAMFLYGRTMVTWWIPVALAAAVALATGLLMWRMWRWFTTAQGFALNYAVHAIAFTCLLTFAGLGLNYWGADPAAVHEEKAEVVRKYTRERSRTRRVGRRYVATGEKYHVYYIVVEFPDGRTKDMEIPFDRYRRLRTGSRITYHMAPGLLDLPVIKD